MHMGPGVAMWLAKGKTREVLSLGVQVRRTRSGWASVVNSNKFNYSCTPLDRMSILSK